MKKFATAALALVIVLGLAVYLLLDSLDGLVKDTIEQVGTELTGTAVTLDGVAIDLGKGSATLRGLTIANPAGYDSDYAFDLKEVTVAIDLASLKGSVIGLKEVIVRGARLNAEQKGERSNLSELLANVEASSKKTEKPASQEPSGESDQVRLALKRFVFANTKATLLAEGQKPTIIKVPDVRRKNIGSLEQGLTPTQLGDALLQAVLEEVEAAVADYLAQLATDALKDKIREKIGLPTNEEGAQ